MADLVSGLLGVLLATNQASAASNFIAERTGAKIEITNPNDPVEQEYQRILELDNSVQAEVDQWITDDQKLGEKGAGSEVWNLRGRIRQRLDSVDKAYKDFLLRNSAHARARVAYGSFLSDTGREADAKEQWEKARGLDPNNAAIWNNLANYYGHNSPVTKAFEYYEKAISLAPNEPVYYKNFATTVYLFRHDATNYFRTSVDAVFDKAMLLYRKALSLDPENFLLATDLAQTYYGIQPPRVKDALEAWTKALNLARDDIEREGVRLHLARWQRRAGDISAAQRELALVTNQMYSVTRSNIVRMLDKPETNRIEARPGAAD